MKTTNMNKIKSAIIYGSLTAITPMHRIVQPTCRSRIYNVLDPADGPHCFVRMEVVEADALHALEMANPMDGETVLNSFEIS